MSLVIPIIPGGNPDEALDVDLVGRAQLVDLAPGRGSEFQQTS
ncbi:hypothetical protein [Geminicoccus flavidas]|nr:hypothetical protein [Geminicoccus flavidas]